VDDDNSKVIRGRLIGRESKRWSRLLVIAVCVNKQVVERRTLVAPGTVTISGSWQAKSPPRAEFGGLGFCLDQAKAYLFNVAAKSETTVGTG